MPRAISTFSVTRAATEVINGYPDHGPGRAGDSPIPTQYLQIHVLKYFVAIAKQLQ